MRTGSRALLFAAVLVVATRATFAQTAPIGGRCTATSVPVPVRTEGLTERVGDILIACGGSVPGTTLSGNFTVVFPVTVSNRVGSTNLTTDAVISADLGGGFVPLPTSNQVFNNQIVFNSVNVTVPPSGNFQLRVSGVRVAAAQFGPTQNAIRAQLIFTGTALSLDQVQVVVAFTQPGLFTTLHNRGAITCVGSPIPETVNLPNLFGAGTFFVSSRVTEGFATAFLPRTTGEDNGARFVLQFSGFPAGTRIFVPDYIAGSNATVQTAGGDLGVPRSGGAWTPGASTLLLGRVTGADTSGAGGTVALPTGVGQIAFTGASEIALSASGSGAATFEVLDTNVNGSESAQIPVFIGIPPGSGPATATMSLSFGPISTVQGASIAAPIVRFVNIPAGDDCGLVGDCNANYYPKLTVDAPAIRFTAIQGGATFELWGYIRVVNDGGGVMPWTATVRYSDGAGWAFLDYPSGVNTASVRVTADPKGLAPGTYRASIVIDAGSRAGSGTVPVTLVVSPAPSAPPAPPPPPPPPVQTPSVTVSKVVNAATFEPTPLVAGSLGTAMGTNLAGKIVGVSLDGVSSDILYTSATQINFVVPPGLRGKASASMVVTVDGVSAAPQTVVLAPSWPSVFARGVLNQDNSLNTPTAAAAAGSVLQIYATGLADGATVSVQIGDRKDLVPLYAGRAPDVPGVQQVNVAVPDGLTGTSAPLVVCAAMGSQSFCSTGYTVAVR
jgi:uncharacterized protein (TIGR03437 family)